MNRLSLWLGSGALIIACVGCAQKESPAAADKPAAAAASKPAEAAASQPADAADPSGEALAVPADFEAEVEAEITPDNYAEQLDALEKELAAE